MRTLIAAAMAAATGLAQQGTDFRSQTQEVLLELVVRDAHGKPVTKLDASQLSIFEDGVKQEIKAFRLVPGHEVRAAASAPGGTPSPALAASPSAVSTHPLRTINVVCLILHDLNPETRGFAFDSARKFVNKELRPDTYIGVFSLDSRGLRPVFPFSNNRENLLKAIELAAVNQLPSLSLSSASVLNGLSIATLGYTLNPIPNAVTITIPAPPGGAPGSATIEGPPPVGVPTNTDGSSLQDPLGVRGDMGLAVNAGLREIDALVRLVRQLSQLPFQKTVLLMSTGITRPTDQLDYWNSLIAQANKGGVTFYGMDVYGLNGCQDRPQCAEGTTSAQGGTQAVLGTPGSTPSSASGALLQSAAMLGQGQSTVGLGPRVPNPYAPGGSSTSSPSTPAARMAESMHQTDYVRSAVLSANTQEALREISESTGGFVIANTNNTEVQLARVMEEVDTHYEVSYRPASPSIDGHFCKIEVKLSDAGLRVQTRNGYYAVPDTGEGSLTPGDMAALEALDRQPLPFDFGFEAGAFRFRSGKGTAQYAIAFEIPVLSLTAAKSANVRRFRAHLLALVKNEHGNIVERVSKDVHSGVDDKVFQGLQTDTMIYERAVNLAPGRYTVEAAVVDEEGHRVSTTMFKINNREETGPGLSDIALVARIYPLDRAPDPADPFEIPGKRAQPFVNTALPAGARPYIYFVAYPEPNLPEPSMVVQLLREGRVIETQTPALGQPDASGAVPMAIQPAAAAGDFEVKVIVRQDGQYAERSLKYSIAAN
ncbi:MAG TPA: VWA domain-containing protein [Bryobacteraceae bacterium]|nr:VWA domain-containing protein [Bryobacteraceae bacterium]